MSVLSRAKARLQSDDGAILVLSAFLLIVLIALVAFVVDLTMQSTDRQHLWNSSDSAALAGAALLPDGIAAEAEAANFALANDAELTGGKLTTSFRCLVADRDGNGLPDAGEVPGACDPGADISVLNPADWTCGDGICVAVCVPADGDTCNTIVLETEKTTDYAFAPAIGYDEGTSEILSAACRGSCGAGLTGPVDLVMILDRSGSMSPADMDKVERASMALLDFFDPAQQHVGLAVLPPANRFNECVDETDYDDGRWLIVPLSSDYKDSLNYDFNIDGTMDLDLTSELVDRIKCGTDDGYTDLGSPIRDSSGVTDEFADHAYAELLNNGRPGVKKGILFLSDGGANRPSSASNPCRFANQQASAAKAAGIEIYTIGFGVDNPGASGRIVTCEEDESGPYAGANVTKLLADMATQPSDDNCTVATTDFENNDGDYFFCIPKDENLSDVFLAIATQFAKGSRLVQLP